MPSDDDNYSDYYSEDTTSTEQIAPTAVETIPVEKYQELESKFNQTSQVIDNLRNVFNPQPQQQGQEMDQEALVALQRLRQHGVTTQDEVRQMIAQELQQSQIDNHARQAGYTGVNELFAEWNLTKIRSGNNPQAQAMLNQIENTWNSGNIQGAINSFKSFVQGGNNQIPSQTQVIGHQMNNMSNFNKQRNKRWGAYQSKRNKF